MPNPLVECIPNFSEARRPEVVEAIVAAIAGVPEIALLNQSSDNDHNRSVVTYLGEAAGFVLRFENGLNYTVDADRELSGPGRL